MSKYDDLLELLEDVAAAEDDRPESCSCHINPPCSHCCFEPLNDAQYAVDIFISDWSKKE